MLDLLSTMSCTGAAGEFRVANGETRYPIEMRSIRATFVAHGPCWCVRHCKTACEDGGQKRVERRWLWAASVMPCIWAETALSTRLLVDCCAYTQRIELTCSTRFADLALIPSLAALGCS